MPTPTPEQVQYYLNRQADDRRVELYAVSISTLLLAWLFVALRFVSRWRIKTDFRLDDWLVLAAAVTFTAYPIGMFILISVGFGRHIIFVDNAQVLVEMLVLCEIAYSITIPLTKLSILYFLHRIFPSEKLFKTSIGIAVVTILYSLALALVCVLQCIPLSTLWGATSGWCMNTTAPYTVTAVANVVTDIAVLSLPMPILYRLHMKTARKVQVMGIFALGGCVCIFGIVRSIEVGTASPIDQSWSTVNGSIWSAVEPCVGIISACLPTLRGLMRRDREDHTGYTDYEREGTTLGRFGWTAGRGGGGGGDTSYQAAYPFRAGRKPRLWSVVSSSLRPTGNRSRHDPNEPDEPLTRLDCENKAPTVATICKSDSSSARPPKSSHGNQVPACTFDDPRRIRTGVHDIHVQTDMTLEIAPARNDI